MATTSTAQIKFPFGLADVQTPAYAATQAITITDALTILRPAIATGATTLNITTDANVPTGALLFVVWLATATEVLTFGTAIDGIVITGVAGKTKTKLFVYDGAVWIAVGEQID